jgi:hypothetical protein
MTNLRNQTMNRLNEASSCMPGAQMPVPVMPLSIFEELLYKVAYEYGYTGTKAEFSEDFLNSLNGLSSNIVQSGSISEFPEVGTEGAIYIDSENGEIYYWKDEQYVQLNKQEGPMIPSDGLIYDGGEI